MERHGGVRRTCLLRVPITFVESGRRFGQVEVPVRVLAFEGSLDGPLE